jgi:TolB protein
MTWRNRTAAVALAAVLVGGCSASAHHDNAVSGRPVTSTPTPVTQAAARGVEAAISTIPWTQVGPGWLLATWSQVPGRRPGGDLSPGEPTPATATTMLYLVDPAGGRYPITSFPPPGAGPSPTIADWSGDGTHALFYANAPAPSGTYTVTTVDLRSGAQASFTIDNGANSFDVAARYSRPQGKAILLAKSNGAEADWLKRVDLTGRPELAYPVGRDFQGSYLSTPDGTQLVLGMATGLALMGNDGTAGKTLPITGAQDCAPTRWWDANSTVVARCRGHGPARLWLVPINGARPTALTAPLNGQGPDYADLNAWQLPSDTFVQVAGACGSEYLGKLSGVGGTTTRVDVPGVDPHSSIRVIGPNDGHLVVQGRASCGGGQTLFDYDPAANASTVLLGPPLNAGGVIAALPYPGRG